LGRIVALTIGFMAIGIGIGAVAAVVTLAIVSLAAADGLAFKKPAVFAIAATLGALIGAACGPVAGWLVYRRVSPRRAIAGVLLGTIVGGITGWYIPAAREGDGLLIPPMIGFIGAAVLLRAKKRAARSPGTPEATRLEPDA
jgi:MFS family permease